MFGITRRASKPGTSGVVSTPPSAKPGATLATPSRAPVEGVRSMSFEPIQTPRFEDDREKRDASVNASRFVSTPPAPVARTNVAFPTAPTAPSSGSGDSIIGDVRKIPKGGYMAFSKLHLPTSFNEHFVLLSLTDTHYTLLVDHSIWKSSSQFEVTNRIKLSHKGCSVSTVRVTQEVLLTLHKENEQAMLGSFKESSDLEESAWTMINSAIEQNTSDIHIETRGSYAQVFFRIYGERVEQHPISLATASGMCNVLYSFHAESRSKDVSWKPEEVMDTAIEHRTRNGTPVQIRFSSSPIHPSPNFHAVCRLLVMDERRTPSLHEVGFTTGQVSAVEDMLIGAQGMVLLVGPTNSGKSTTMQACARRIVVKRGGNIKLITVEDPVEYIISGACQMGVSHGRKGMQGKDGSAFNTLLKGTLRQDPDVVIVGEIRDGESCSAVKDLVLAGRKLISTLHVYEAMAVYARLRELGVPESILYMNNFISGVIYQRLVPTLCPDCSISLIDGQQQGLVDPHVFERVSRSIDLMATNVRMRNPGGCEKCGHRGIVGRTLCAEMLIPDETFLAHMRRGDLASARAYWQTNVDLNVEGLGVTAVAHALCKMVTGLVDPHDIESQIGRVRVEHGDNTSIPGLQVSYQDGHQAYMGMGSGNMHRYLDEEVATNRLTSLYS